MQLFLCGGANVVSNTHGQQNLVELPLANNTRLTELYGTPGPALENQPPPRSRGDQAPTTEHQLPTTKDAILLTA